MFKVPEVFAHCLSKVFIFSFAALIYFAMVHWRKTAGQEKGVNGVKKSKKTFILIIISASCDRKGKKEGRQATEGAN